MAEPPEVLPVNSEPKYPPRVTRGPDGIYRWHYVISQKQNRHGLRITLIVMGALCVFLMGMGLTMGRDAFLVILLSCGGVMLITGLICWLFDRLSKNGVPQAVELSEDYVRWVGRGRTDFYYHFRGTERVRVLAADEIIEIRQLLGVMQVYVPREDFGFVQDFILRHIPPDTNVEYD